MDSFLKIIEIHKSKSALVVELRKLRPATKLQVAHISNWVNRDGKIPSEWVIACSHSVQWKVTPHELRADLYPHPMDGLPAHLRLHEADQNLLPAHGPECCASMTTLST